MAERMWGYWAPILLLLTECLFCKCYLLLNGDKVTDSIGLLWELSEFTYKNSVHCLQLVGIDTNRRFPFFASKLRELLTNQAYVCDRD